ncbi:MAG: hypothetical protein KF832_08840 [Caldilineaceae bacterium]|nr:hypothetical protein [Caldilineaceae bacterium]
MQTEDRQCRVKELPHLDHTEVATLLTMQAGPCISCFWPLTAAGAPEAETDHVPSLLHTAKRQLATYRLSPTAIDQLLAPLTLLAEAQGEAHDPSGGIACFITPQRSLAYHLPLALSPLVVVGPHPYLRPLLPMLAGNEEFYLLVLGKNAVRLWQGTHTTITAVPLFSLPAHLPGSRPCADVEQHQQWHAAGSYRSDGWSSVSLPEREEVGAETIDAAPLLPFLQRVDQIVTRRLARIHAPLLLAGVATAQELYRTISHYPHVIATGLNDTDERTTPATLQAAAWHMVASLLQDTPAQALARYHRLAEQGDGHTVTEIKNVVLAALYQQVDTLFITPATKLWGRLIPESHQVVVHKEANPGDEELINLALLYTLQHHGAAYLVAPAEIQESSSVAALLRY